MPKLSNRVVDAAQATDKDLVLWDSELPGFGLRCKKSAVKSFIIQYRNAEGRSKRMTIGRHGVLTPDQARRIARTHLADVVRGTDPAGRRTAGLREPTVADLAERYMTQHVAQKKKASSARMDRVNLKLHVLPALGRNKVSAVTRADVSALHHKMRDTPGAANRVLALLSKMFNLAEKWDLRHDGSNPCRHVERYRERKLERFLSAAELTRLGEVMVEAERTGTEMPSALAAIRLLALTGCRLSEILTLRWDYVDFERICLRLPDSKTGAKVVHLTPPALEILDKLERHGPYVIAGRDPEKHLVNLRKPWYRLRKQAGLDDVRLHDLRHSFASVGAAMGLSLPLIGALLGHRNTATTARYAHLADDPVRRAAEAVSGQIAAAMSGEDADVTPLAKRTP